MVGLARAGPDQHGSGGDRIGRGDRPGPGPTPGLAFGAGSRDGPAALALCRWFDSHRLPGQIRTVKVSVNDQPAQVFELADGPGEHVVEFPADQLAEGGQHVAFEPAGPGRYVYDVMLSGVLTADQLQSTTQAWHVTRPYAPRP